MNKSEEVKIELEKYTKKIIEKTIDILIEKAKEPEIIDNIPVFLEEPKNSDLVWFLELGIVHGLKYIEVKSIEDYDWDKGHLWRTKEAVTNYANHKAIYKLLQIIYMDFQGEPTKEDWRDGNIEKYNLYYNTRHEEFDKTYSSHHKCTGKIYMKKEPNIDKIVSEMGELMEYFK